MEKSSKEASTGSDQAVAKDSTKRNAAKIEAEASTKNGAAMGGGAARYGKAQIFGSIRYRGQRDLVSALLEEGEQYSLEEVDGLLEDYLKGRVM